jgi:hypothetical protein
MPIEGASEVATQFGEAVSRAPERFFNLFKTHWNDIADVFKNRFLYGIANHIRYRFGNLQKMKTGFRYQNRMKNICYRLFYTIWNANVQAELTNFTIRKH